MVPNNENATSGSFAIADIAIDGVPLMERGRSSYRRAGWARESNGGEPGHTNQDR
jgi:hypothetical protein